MKNKPGYVWVPYVTNCVVEEISTPLKVIRSRYSKKIINSRMYGTFNGQFYIQPNEERKSRIENIFKIKNPTD